jgi:hypothetical protein
MARKAASIAAREARTAAREAYRAEKPARLATRFATRTTVVRAARAVAELAASGHEPRLRFAVERFDGPFNNFRVYMADAVKAGVAVYEGVDAGRRLYWPGPRAVEALGEELAAAWEAARVLPPQGGTVRVGGCTSTGWSMARRSARCRAGIGCCCAVGALSARMGRRADGGRWSMGERSVSAAEARGREGLAWLTGVASLRRDTALMARQVLAWVQAVETQRGEARDEASAAEARCDEGAGARPERAAG